MESTIVEDDIVIEPQHNLETNDNSDESLLEQEISSLWSEHVCAQTTQRATSKELRFIRTALAEKLHSMKALLCRPGCGGEWSGWLQGRGIPRSTADRLVARHEESLNGADANLLSGSTKPQDEVEALLQSVLPRLRRVLTTEAMAYRFIWELVKEFNVLRWVSGDGLELAQPFPYGYRPTESPFDPERTSEMRERHSRRFPPEDVE